MLTRQAACGSILGHTCGPGPVLPCARSIPVPDTRPTPPGHFPCLPHIDTHMQACHCLYPVSDSIRKRLYFLFPVPL